MAADDALITLGELLQVPPPSARRGASASAALPTATRPVAPPAHQLHSSLFKELSAVDALFSRWQAEVEAKQRAAAAACDFEDHAAFSAALLVLNKRGERRRGTRAAQEWYFVPRHASVHAGDLGCSRCCLHIVRRQEYYVDRAAAAAQADEVCRRCMVCLMRGLLGQDDAAILEEAQLILDSAWSPRFNAAQLDILPARGTLLAEL